MSQRAERVNRESVGDLKIWSFKLCANDGIHLIIPIYSLRLKDPNHSIRTFKPWYTVGDVTLHAHATLFFLLPFWARNTTGGA